MWPLGVLWGLISGQRRPGGHEKAPGDCPGVDYPNMTNEASMAANMAIIAAIWAAVCAGVVNLIPLYAFM